MSLFLVGSFAVGTLGCVGLVGGGMASLMSTLKGAEPVQAALAIVETDPVGCLGTDVEEGWFVTGESNYHNGDATVSVRVPVTGTQGAGSVYVNAERTQGVWTTHAMDLSCPDGSVHDLLMATSLSAL